MGILHWYLPDANFRRAATHHLQMHFPDKSEQVWRSTLNWQSRLAPNRPRHSASVNLYIPKPQLRGKRAALVVSSVGPYPYNLLRSQSGGTVGSLKTILKAGGIKIVSVLNIPDSYNFEKQKERYMRKARQIAAQI